MGNAYVAEDQPDADATINETFGVLPELEPPSRDEWDRGSEAPVDPFPVAT